MTSDLYPETPDKKTTRLPILFYSITEACNSRCITCDFWKQDSADELSGDEIAAFVDSLKDIEIDTFVFTGGEPLLHKSLFEICKMLKERMPNTKIRILTNGILLKKYAHGVTQYCDQTVVSLDGATDDVYGLIRGVRNLKNLEEGIALCRQLNPAMKIKARCTVQKGNYSQLPDIVRKARQMGLDQISFLAADISSSSAFGRDGKNERSNIALSESDIYRLDAIIRGMEQEFSGEFANGFIAESPEQLREILLGYFLAMLTGDTRYKPVCNAPFVSASVDSRGNVAPCFFMTQTYGNVRNTPLNELLHSNILVQIQRDSRAQAIEACNNCVCPLYLPNH